MSELTAERMHDLVWTRWASIPPPKNTHVLALYDYSKNPFRCKTCKRGCCIDAGFGPQMLPEYWSATDDQSALEYVSIEITPEMYSR